MVPSGIEPEESVIVAKEPRSAIAEPFRTLRTNLEFASVNHPLRTILITGPDPGSGKTTVATNLALIIAHGGKKVLLLDGDLRRPRIHQLLGLHQEMDMSDLFRERADADSTIQMWGENEVLCSARQPWFCKTQRPATKA
jgi:Mrp family chromosome partitioning ATPase